MIRRLSNYCKRSSNLKEYYHIQQHQAIKRHFNTASILKTPPVNEPKEVMFHTHEILKLQQENHHIREDMQIIFFKIAFNTASASYILFTGYPFLSPIFMWYAGSGILKVNAFRTQSRKIISSIVLSDDQKRLAFRMGLSEEYNFTCRISKIEIQSPPLEKLYQLVEEYNNSKDENLSSAESEFDDLVVSLNIETEEREIQNGLIIPFNRGVVDIQNLDLLISVLSGNEELVRKYMYQQESEDHDHQEIQDFQNKDIIDSKSP